MMSRQEPAVSLWVKAEPFSYGAFPIAPHPRLNINNIKKIVIYAKNKGEAGFPKISYSVWRHIACNKLHLSESLAWMYFSRCHFLSENTSAVERLEWDHNFAGSSKDEKGLAWILILWHRNTHSLFSSSSRSKVPCENSCHWLTWTDLMVAFDLHPFGHEFDTPANKPPWIVSTTGEKMHSVKNPTSSDTEELERNSYIQTEELEKATASLRIANWTRWPTRSSSPDLDGRSTPRNSNKSLDDHSHMVFVQNNLHEILDMLVEPDNDSGYPGDVSLSQLAVEALSFLLAGSMDRCKTLMPLQDIAMLQTLQHRSGYSKMKKTFSLRLFQTWIKDCLVQNPFGISACIASGRRLSWPMAGEEKDNLSETKRGRIATNAHAVPKEHMKGNKIIIMSQVGKQTIARSSSTLENSCVKIHRCHSAYIYLLSPLRSVTVEKCRNSTIVLGPVECAVFLSHCESVTLIACARTVLISSSTLCTLHLLTPNPPAILSGNDSITLAPYHTYYPRLEEHMAVVGIGAERNLWDEPLCVGPDHKEDSPVWEIMPVQDFFTFNIPLEMEGTTKSIPGGLPGKYQRAVNQRYKQIDAWQKTVKESGLSRDQRKEFQSLVESRFHVWLSESGHKRELDSLVLPQQGKKSQ